MLESVKLAKLVDRLKNKRVLVIGDVMIDENIKGRTTRISPEAAIPIVLVERKEWKLGGAANVVSNILSLGGQPVCIGVVGKDSMGRKINSLFKENGTECFLITDGSRPTTTKTRILSKSQGGYHPIACRIDEENAGPIEGRIAERILKITKRVIDKIDCVILSDYNKGVLNNPLSSSLIQIANAEGKDVFVDPKPENVNYFKNCAVITPNKEEAEKISGIKYSVKNLEAIGKAILEKLEPKHVIITCGEDGMFIYGSDGFEHVSTKAIDVNDVTGAGDTVIATLALSAAAGLTIEETTVLANYAAAIVIRKVGTATATQKELKESILNPNRLNGTTDTDNSS